MLDSIDFDKLSPGMKQYYEIKKQHLNEILFFRLGDFYELFFDDALLCSKELELTLTGKDCGLEERAPMCGIPYHAVDNYVSKLIKKGYKVAICEQLEDPATAKSVVKRGIIRVITPGTLIESNILEDERNNYIASIFSDTSNYGIVFADISTGFVNITTINRSDLLLINELSKYSPNEVILNEDITNRKDVLNFLSNILHCTLNIKNINDYQSDVIEQRIKNQYPDLNSISSDSTVFYALGILLLYLDDTQITGISRLQCPRFYDIEQYMKLNLVTRRNLDLTENQRTNEKKGSLLGVLDKTQTAMGKRLVRSVVEQPLISPAVITRRLDAVNELFDNPVLNTRIRNSLDGVYDIERLMTRVVYGNATPKDVISLGDTTEKLPYIKQLLSDCQSSELNNIYENIDILDDIHDLITSSIDRDSSVQLKDGGVIKDGYNQELDELRYLSGNTKDIIATIETKERERTGIKTLKVGYNKVFGYYIEVTNSFKDQVPDEYIRKQTLVGGERYITQELKDLEYKVISAQEKIIILVNKIFNEVRKKISEELDRLQRTATAISWLDLYSNFAFISLSNHYVRPEITVNDDLLIKDGRHPVVECAQKDIQFVPNDLHLDNKDQQIAVITGPNMAGKSTYMRQNALIVLMAQIGCFVPASYARIGLVDGIFTRVGASDDLSAGQSTFMVEMSEVATILRDATSKSLLILDEIGRGTSTFDGMSIARAVLEYIADRNKLGAKTLFATHYHELIQLENSIPCLKNYNIAVQKRGEDIIFLRRIIPGGVDESYGIEVSKLAGIPKWVIDRAHEVLENLENSNNIPEAKIKSTGDIENHQAILLSEKDELLKRRLNNLDLDELSPREALNILYELKYLAKP